MAKVVKTKTVQAVNGEWPFVEVIWRDTVSVCEWVTMATLPKIAVMSSRGWLVIDDPEHVIVAATYEIPTSSAGVDCLGDVVAIPRGCIVSVTNLETERARRGR